MPVEIENTYDLLPLPSVPHPQTHPDWLATVGTLLGMEPPAVEKCRVLEIGCGSGGNLLPMAATLPDSTFVGVDLSPRQIAAGQAMVARAGLTNVELRHASVLDIDDGDGPFDYILCYGVFSRVARPEQDGILAICQRHLTPQGVAYVNFNAYPGGYLMDMMRDMMLFAARGSREPEARVSKARAFLDLLVEWGPHPDLRPFVTPLVENLRKVPDSFVYHEFLEERNERFYFLDFMSRAKGAGLQYLAEAQLTHMFSHYGAPDAARDTLAELAPSLELREQYLDFLQNRRFRETLLCRKEAALRRSLGPRTMTSLWFDGQLTATSSAAIQSAEVVTFQARGGAALTTSSPVAKATFARLNEAWPGATSYADLSAFVREILGDGSADVAGALWHLLTHGLVDVRRGPHRFRIDVGERPRASALARAQAAMGVDVTNLRHRLTQPDPFSRRVLAELDGTSDRAQIAERLGLGDVGESRVEAAVGLALRALASDALLLS